MSIAVRKLCVDIKSKIIKPLDVSAALGLNSATIPQWVKKGKLPPYDFKVGRRARGWKFSTLHAFDSSLTAMVENYLAAREESRT
jgi:predicted DNA-binding transcriptional regulator AlpA